MESLTSISHLLDESWTVNDFIIKVNNKEIADPILTYEVMYKGSEVIGIISWRDTQDFIKQAAPTVGGRVDVYFTSQKGSNLGQESKFEGTYWVTKVTRSGDNTPTIEIMFGDEVNVALNQTFATDSFEDTLPSEIINQIGNKYLNQHDFFVAGPEEEEECTIQIPSHKSLKQVIGYFLEEKGFNTIIDKSSTYFVHTEQLEDSKAVHTGETFYWQPSLVYTRYQVIEYELDGFSLEKLAASSSKETLATSRASIGTENQNLSVNVKEGNTQVSKTVGTVGTQVGTDVNTAVNTKESLSAQTMRIWVPGWNGDRLGKKVTVELPLPESLQQSSNDKTFSGDWVVEMSRDKIISSYFVQELHLRRSDV